MLTLDRDIRPAFGAAEETLASYYREGIFRYGPRFDRIMQDFASAAQLSDALPKSTILLCGMLSRNWCSIALLVIAHVRRMYTW